MYYPYHGSKAGVLRDRHYKARSAEYLLADDDIIMLAKETLTEAEYQEAEELAKKLAGRKKGERNFARYRLAEIVKPPPKRPIYYAQEEMFELPHRTRNALRFLGDFIDILVKSAVFEREKNKRIFGSSLGPAINKFEQFWPECRQLTEFLRTYNRFLYKGAKHDFSLPQGRETHRFTSREVVISAFVTMNLAERITAISNTARKVRQDKKILP